MKTFKQVINEVFNKPVKWKWTKRERDYYVAEFNVEDSGETVPMMIRITSRFDLASAREIAEGKGRAIWEFVFSTSKDYAKGKGKSDIDIQNFKDPKAKFVVFSTVIEAGKEYAKKVKPEIFYLTAKEPSRKKLYKIMTKRFSKELGFNLDIFTMGGLEYYMLFKDKKWYKENKEDILDEME